MPDKKKCRISVCKTETRRADQFTQLNPTEVYHAGTAFVKRRMQDV